MSTMPADAHAFALFPIRDSVTNKIDNSGDFVARHPRIFEPWPQTVFDENVAMANSARFNFYANLSATWLWNVALDDFKISTGFADLCGFHFHICPLLVEFLFVSSTAQSDSGRIRLKWIQAVRRKHGGPFRAGWFQIEVRDVRFYQIRQKQMGKEA
jgi:hypothetical protein